MVLHYMQFGGPDTLGLRKMVLPTLAFALIGEIALAQGGGLNA